MGLQKGDKVAIVSMENWWKELDGNVKRLKEETEKQGFVADILFYDKFFITFNDKKIGFWYGEKKKNMKDYSLIIPVINVSKDLEINTFFIKALEELGIPVKNKVSSILKAKNKARTTFILAQKGIPVVPSAITFSEVGLKPLFNFIKGDEYVCKLNEGSLGKGVSYINSKMSLISTLELLKAGNIEPSRILFQKFIKESAGRDIRVIVAGKKVIGSMQRESEGIDFRSNLAGGGKGTIYQPSDRIKKIAIGAVQALGLSYGGVDVIQSKNGPMVVEVNANPGLKIEKLTATNVAKQIIKHLVSTV